MLNKKNRIIFILFFFILTYLNLNAQNSTYCDSVIHVWDKVCGFGGETPMPLKTITEIDSEITEAILPDTFSTVNGHRIVVEAVIDTNGIVRCTKFLRKSNSRKIDSILAAYLNKLKFTPGKSRFGGKISMPFSMPLPIRVNKK